MKKITSTALAVSALACMISYPVFAADEALPVKVSEPKTKTSEAKFFDLLSSIAVKKLKRYWDEK